MGYAQTAAVVSVLMTGSTVYTELSERSGHLSFDRKVCLFVGCFLAIQCQGERGKTAIWRYSTAARVAHSGAYVSDLAPKVWFYQGFGHFGKTAIWRYGGEGGALWRLGKTAI